MRRNVPYSKEKEIRRVTMLYWKAKLKIMKGKRVDKEIIKKRKEISNIEEEIETIEETKERLE